MELHHVDKANSVKLTSEKQKDAMMDDTKSVKGTQFRIDVEQEGKTF